MDNAINREVRTRMLQRVQRRDREENERRERAERLRVERQRRELEERQRRREQRRVSDRRRRATMRLDSLISKRVRNILDRRLAANPHLKFIDGLGNKNELKRFLLQFAGQRVRVRYIMKGVFLGDDEEIRELDKMVYIPLIIDKRFLDVFAGYLVFYEDGVMMSYPDQDNFNGYLSILTNRQGGIDYGEQTFQHGYTNCVLRHIDAWVNSLPDRNKNKKTLLKKMSNLWTLYSGGVPETALQNVCDELSIYIVVLSPYSRKELINVKKGKIQRWRKKFTFINTREDHVELEEDIETILVEQQEMDDLFELKTCGTLWKQTRDKKVYYMRTGNKEYVIKEEVSKDVINFKKSFQGFNANNNEMLKDYIQYSQLHMGCVDGKAEYNDETLHIDQKNSYASYKQSKYYTGFPAFITDNIQSCDRIQGEGFYFVESFGDLGKLKHINKFLGNLFVDRNVYPANILKMLSDLGGEYKIISGCWGATRHFDFPAEMVENKDYQKFIGILGSSKKHYSALVHGVNFNWLKSVEEVVTRHGTQQEILIPKKKSTYYGHISSYLIAYCAIQTITQLLEMDLDQVVRVCVDGIYTNQEPQLTGSFRFKKQHKLGNTAGGHFFPLVQHGLSEERTVLWGESVYETSLFPNLRSLAYGPGGAGKTRYCQESDVGAVEVLFVFPSHELRARNPEINSVTHEKLLTDQKGENGYCNWEDIARNYSTFAMDEASMLTKEQYQKLINRFPYHKIIMIGDLGYQLPPVTEGQELCEDDFQHKVEFKTDYRSHDRETRQFKRKMRRMMRNGEGVLSILEELYKTTCVKRPVKIGKWCKTQLEKLQFARLNDDVEGVIRGFVGNDYGYHDNDMIIASTNKLCDQYTSYFAPTKEKYKILKNSTHYQNGNIVLKKPTSLNASHYKLRHAFTIHAAQGKTLENKLFIDIRQVKCTRMLYTAISRVHKLSQIVLTNGV